MFAAFAILLGVGLLLRSHLRITQAVTLNFLQSNSPFSLISIRNMTMICDILVMMHLSDV
jgi:hypothetical protein